MTYSFRTRGAARAALDYFRHCGWNARMCRHEAAWLVVVALPASRRLFPV